MGTDPRGSVLHIEDVEEDSLANEIGIFLHNISCMIGCNGWPLNKEESNPPGWIGY